jgi:hypothetical protein
MGQRELHIALVHLRQQQAPKLTIRRNIHAESEPAQIQHVRRSLDLLQDLAVR